MGLFPDAEALAESVDASLLVVRQDYTSSYDINDAIDTLKNSSSKFLGCVFKRYERACAFIRLRVREVRIRQIRIRKVRLRRAP